MVERRTRAPAALLGDQHVGSTAALVDTLDQHAIVLNVGGDDTAVHDDPLSTLGCHDPHGVASDRALVLHRIRRSRRGDGQRAWLAHILRGETQRPSQRGRGQHRAPIRVRPDLAPGRQEHGGKQEG